MLLKKVRDVFGWFLVRYQKGYGLISTFLSAFNFAGIFTLLLQPYVDIPVYLFLPLFILFGIIGIVVLGVFVYDKGNFQSVMAQKDGMLNDYWHKKLPPINQKSLLLSIRMNRAVINKDLEELKKVEDIIKGGLL